MNHHFEIKDKEIIYDILKKAEYGTLAVSVDNTPYAVPLNFVNIGDIVYFHGALKNKKMKILAQNPNVSFSVVENYSIIDSDFSKVDALGCSITQFFKSVSINGMIKIVESLDEKAEIFEAMMKKFQPKGGYRPFEDKAYDKILKATAVFRLVPSNISCKFKFGQHLNTKRFEMIITNLKQRGDELDIRTIEIMKAQKKVNR